MQLKKTKLPLLFVFLVSALFCPFLRVSSLQNDSYQLISSNGTVAYPLLPGLPPSQDLELRGFHVYTRKYMTGVGYVECDQQDYYNMRDWGMTVCRSDCFWGSSIEPYQDQLGVYSTTYIDRLEKHIRMADKAGLKWIIAIRVSFNDAKTFTSENWGWGWGTAAYVCTPDGLDRYCEMLEWWIDTWESKNLPNLIGYQAWEFPFHQTGVSSAQRAFFYDSVLPRISEVVREHSDKLIFATPIHESRLELANIHSSTIEANRGRALYGIQNYDYAGMVHIGTPAYWNYDVNYQINFLQPAIDFKNKYDVPVYVTEFGSKGERQDQADVLDCKLELMNQNDIGYIGYWSYSWYEGANGFSILYQDKTPKWMLVNVLKKWS